MASTVFVGVPWRDRGSAEASASLEAVIESLYGILGEPVHLVDAPTQEWSLAAARNAIVDEASREGSRVVVICDADTIVEAEALREAVEVAEDCGRVVLPYTLFRALTPPSSRAVVSGFNPQAVPDGGTLDWSVGGVFAVDPDVWNRAGRQDERFYGWGCEDTAFAIAAGMLVGPHERVPGVIHHLWHPVTWRPEDESYRSNADLLQRYAQVTGIDEMRALVGEWRASA